MLHFHDHDDGHDHGGMTITGMTTTTTRPFHRADAAGC